MLFNNICSNSDSSHTSFDAGAVITADLLEIKRPGTGFSPNNLKKIIGKKTLRMIKKDKPIKLSYLK